jgi:hypothetical protein
MGGKFLCTASALTPWIKMSFALEAVTSTSGFTTKETQSRRQRSSSLSTWYYRQKNVQLKLKYGPQSRSDSICQVTCAVYNYNGTEVLASYNDDDVFLFDTCHSDEADFVHRYEGHRNSATGTIQIR